MASFDRAPRLPACRSVPATMYFSEGKLRQSSLRCAEFARPDECALSDDVKSAAFACFTSHWCRGEMTAVAQYEAIFPTYGS